MSLNVLGLTFSAVVFLGIFIAAAVAGMKIYRKVRSISRQAFGTENILEDFRQMEVENSTTPKSVAGMTSLYLPKIKKDFPEFQYDEMKVRAEKCPDFLSVSHQFYESIIFLKRGRTGIERSSLYEACHAS